MANSNSQPKHQERESKMAGWISVDKRLPANAPKKGWKDGRTELQYHRSDFVLAWNGSLNVAEMLTNPEGEKVWVCGDETLTKVTHWRELPKPPEQRIA
jgi:hypothetical protein